MNLEHNSDNSSDDTLAGGAEPVVKKVRYAGFGARMLASILDSIAVAIVLYPFAGLFNSIYNSNEFLMLLQQGQTLSPEQMQEFISRQIGSIAYQNCIMSIFVLIFWMFLAATPGKLILRMKIVDAKTLGQVSRGNFFIRYFGYFVSLLPLGAGFIWIHYDKRHQGWHDKMAGTVVIYK